MLYVFRALAGVANGGITSLSMMIVSDIVTLKERGKYQGILGACVGLGNMVGPFIAAAFAQRSTWRGLFWLVSPLAALCCLVCFFILPPSNQSSKLDFRTVMRKIDYWGILFGSAAIMLILMPVSGGGSYFAWDSPLVISMLAVGGSCALAFIFIEYKIALLPMMPCKFSCTTVPLCLMPVTESSSITLHKSTCMRASCAKLPLWDRLLLAALLSPTLLPERATNVTNNIGCSCVAHHRNTDDIFHYFRTVYFQTGAVWRSYLDRVLPLDTWSRSYLYF